MNDIRDGHYTLGIAYLNAEQYDEAIEQLEKTVSVDAGFIEAHHALALAYFGHHRLQDAKDAALEALKIDATYQPTLTFLQTIDPSVPATPQVAAVPTVQPEVTATPVEKEETPVPNVEQTAAERTPVEKENAPPKVDGTDIDKELERGAVFLSNKQYTQAEAAFKKVLKASPNHAIAHYHLAQTYMEAGALTDAKIEVDKALRLNPAYQPAQQLKEGIAYLADREKQKQLRKKLIKYLVPLAAVLIVGFIAVRYGVFSGIMPQPTPPQISIDTTLEDPSNNNGYIDAGENVRLKITISNQGGAAKSLKLHIVPKTIGGLRYNIPDRTLNIGKNGFETIRIPITADQQARTKRALMRIEVLNRYQTALAATDRHLSIKAK